GLRKHLLRLATCAVTDRYAGSNGAAVALDSSELNFQPVFSAGNIVAKQGRRFVHVHDQHVHVAIVVEVTEGAPAAGVSIGDARSGFLEQLLESTVAKATENQAGRLERVRGKLFLHFRIDAAGHGEQVR